MLWLWFQKADYGVLYSRANSNTNGSRTENHESGLYVPYHEVMVVPILEIITKVKLW